MRKLVLVLLLISSQIKVFAQTTFYDLATVQEIKLYVSQPNWDYQLDTMKVGSDGYLMIDSAHINNVPFYHPGVKYKGNSSYDSTYKKNPFHISLDEFENFDYQGITEIKLSNGYADPSMIREVMAYQILQKYMECPRSNFAKLYINNEYVGIYSNDEDISKGFCADRFLSKKGNTFIKCNPIVNPSTNTKSNLKYINGDSSSYINFYELKSKRGWNELVALCDSILNNNGNIEQYIDIDRVIWMLAFNSVTINLDSYSGAFCQNYYLFKDDNNVFNPVVWDLNMAFGGFPFIGVSNSSLGTLSIANMQTLTPTIHASDAHWPLINIVMNNASYRKKYFAHMWTILVENFVYEQYLSSAQYMQTLIDPYVQTDVNKFFTYNQFLNGMIDNTSIGNYSVPGIKTLMSTRTSYLQSFSEINVAQPIINAITQSQMNTSDSTIIISCSIDDAESVYLNYRNSSAKEFTKIRVYDNSDHVYKAEIKIIPDVTEYYVYAENSEAGIFEPARAEKEFYIAKAVVNTGFSEHKKISDIVVYPNPASSKITISASDLYNSNYRIVNALGETMVDEVYTSTVTLDTESWANGIYLFISSSGNRKIIISK